MAEGYNAVSVFEDLGVQFLAYPTSFRLGGNTKGVNSYEGIDIANLTGGVYDSDVFLDYKNTTAATCFVAQFISEAVPDFAHVGANELAAIDAAITKYIIPITGGAVCPKLSKISESTPFDKYPGHTYNPTGPGNIGGPEAGDDKPDCCKTPEKST